MIDKENYTKDILANELHGFRLEIAAELTKIKRLQLKAEPKCKDLI